MIDLNMQTALFIFELLSIASAILVLLIYKKYHNTVSSIFNFTYFYFFSIIGTTLILFRDIVNSFFSVIVANIFLILAIYALSFAIHKFNKHKVHLRLYIVSILFFIALFLYYTYIDAEVIARIVIYSTFSILILIDILRSEQKIYKQMSSRDEIMFIVLLVILLTHVFRIINLFVTNENHLSFFEFDNDASSVLFLAIANFMISAGIFSKISIFFNNEIAESNRINSSLISNLPGFAYRCKNDEQWTMELLTERFVEVTGYDIKDCIGNKLISYNDIILPEFRKEVHEAWQKSIHQKGKYIGEYKIKQKNGTEIWVWEQGFALFDSNGNIEALEGFITSINTRKNLENNLQFMSYHDGMTGIYNRRFIEEELLRLNTQRNFPLTLIMADINGLKLINDTFGHAKGDELIIETAMLLKSVLRVDELLGRLGGDEFLIALPRTSPEEAEIIVKRINQVIDKRGKDVLGLSLSIGYATKDTMAASINSILKLAEDRMYASKTYNRSSSSRKVIDAVIATLYEKDEYSEAHSYNVSMYSKELAFHAGFSIEDVNKIETAGLLHDIGKIIISKRILTVSKKLTEAEYGEIKKHPEIGVRILMSVPEFKELSNIILCHHERIDGLGYPRGIEGDQIPIEAKIIAIADAWDAMIGTRVYRTPLTVEAAIQELLKNKGTQFDSKLVDIFVEKIANNKLLVSK
ncbi:MAG: diguanylate cyclase [Bacilli bacterium]|nr:diguanylate cyclase [Bacilli bacterium]